MSSSNARWLRLLLAMGAGIGVACQTIAAEPVRLTKDGTRKFSPLFIDGGDTVVYTLFANPTLMRLMRLRVSDGTSEPVNKQAGSSEFEPAISADGRVMAFVQLRGVLSLALEIRDLETNRRTEVPPADGFAGMRSPAVSPDHLQVIYSFADAGRQKLYQISSEGGSPKMLTDGPGIDNWPSFSPDGRKIVFSSTRDGNFEIYVMDLEHRQVRRLTDNPRQDIRPRYSPDGKRIAFTSYRDGDAHVYLMADDGSGVQRIATGGERDDFPNWHPAGRQVVLVSEQNGHQDLYLADAPHSAPTAAARVLPANPVWR